MKIFYHHIYEYKKGLRNFVLHTLHSSYQENAENLLIKHEIDYVIHRISEKKVNIFFGNKSCVDTLLQFGTLHLNELSDEQDFILGIMLGYSIPIQCERFLKRTKSKQSQKIKKPINF